MLFKKILCPVDFSEPSKAALETAAKLANDYRAELVVVHAWESPLLTQYSELIIKNDRVADVLQNQEDALAAWKNEVQALGFENVRTKLLFGVPWDAIVRESRSEPYDVIVIGTHGRTGIKHALLGSVAERVARHASCPVLLVHERVAERRGES